VPHAEGLKVANVVVGGVENRCAAAASSASVATTELAIPRHSAIAMRSRVCRQRSITLVGRRRTKGK
jgi:hypothetical protein